MGLVHSPLDPQRSDQELASNFAAMLDRLSAILKQIEQSLCGGKAGNSVQQERIQQVHLLCREFANFALIATRTQLQESGVVSHKTQMLVGHSRRILSQWPQIENLVQRHLRFRRQPLVPRKEDLSGREQDQRRITDGILKQIHKAIDSVGEDQAIEAASRYGDVALPQSLFIDQLHGACRIWLAQEPSQALAFLDVGCGTGLKVLTSAQNCASAEGIEIDPRYARQARKIIRNAGLSNCKIHLKDAFEFQSYKNFQIIYYYQPIKNPELFAKFERHIIASAQPGTLVIAPRTKVLDDPDSFGCAHIAGHIYVTQSNQATARKLRKAAEKIGPDTANLVLPSVDSVWRPLLETAARQGFQVSRPLEF